MASGADHLKSSRVLMTGKCAFLIRRWTLRSWRAATSSAMSSSKKAAGESFFLTASRSSSSYWS